MNVTRLPGPFGADITNVDLSQPLAPSTAKELVDALVEHHVLRVRGQTLNRSAYAALGPIFGKPILFFVAGDRDTEFPELINISNSPDLPVERRDGAAHWHTDGSYEYLPASTTMLYAVEAPDDGGETLLVDMTAAYEALPADIRTRIDGLQVLHRLTAGKRFAEEKQLDDASSGYGGESRREKTRHEMPVHPLVLRHPVSGRKALYAVGGSSFGIVGMAPEEGEALLLDLKRHAIQPRFRTAVKAHAGDLLIWDNLATMHCAVPIEYSAEPGRRRVLIRLSTTGLPEIYGHLAPPFDPDASRAASERLRGAQ